MSFVAAAIGGGAVLGAGASMYAGTEGADAQAGATNASNQAQLDMYYQSRADQMPWLKAGKGGLNALMALQGFTKDENGKWAQSPNASSLAQMQMQMDPGYKFRLAQGMDSVQNSAAARGGLLSGNTLKALTDYSQNTASNEYMNAFNRLAGISGTGQAQANNLGTLGANTANNIGNGLMSAGQARASGYAGQANALNGLVNNGIGLYAGYQNGLFG